jgi:nicotinamide riboside transporter PnuC
MLNIISSITGLATTYIDSKAKVKAAEAETKMKLATGEISWEQAAIEASKDSWKDELWTIVFVLILVLNFIPSMQDIMARGFANLETTPMWVQWGMYASIAASFGIRTMRGFGKK